MMKGLGMDQLKMTIISLFRKVYVNIKEKVDCQVFLDLRIG